eukprot:1157687-Pelagomonas_calceolata.AAC.2
MESDKLLTSALCWPQSLNARAHNPPSFSQLLLFTSHPHLSGVSAPGGGVGYAPSQPSSTLVLPNVPAPAAARVHCAPVPAPVHPHAALLDPTVARSHSRQQQCQHRQKRCQQEKLGSKTAVLVLLCLFPFPMSLAYHDFQLWDLQEMAELNAA